LVEEKFQNKLAKREIVVAPEPGIKNIFVHF
jgi:hypothetical protein